MHNEAQHAGINKEEQGLKKALITKALTTAVAVTLLVACGGGTSSTTSTPSTALASSQLYTGYYLEDPTTNPEDPMPGTLYLNLPTSDSQFSGAMSFTYVGCQTASVGIVSGTKTGEQLTGEWSGNIDGSAQRGSYKGAFDSTKKTYQGTYTNSQGKQYRDLSPCIKYWLAPQGTWELFAVNSTSTEDAQAESLKITGNKMTWSVPSAKQNTSAESLISIIDKEKAIAGTEGAVVSQAVIEAALESYDIPATVLSSGSTYIASVAIGSRTSFIYFSSKEFVAP